MGFNTDDDAVQHAVGAIKILMKRTERLHGGAHPIDHASVDSIARYSKQKTKIDIVININ